MAEQYSEIITGRQIIINTLRPLIGSRTLCKMGIRGATQNWITLLLEIRSPGNTYHLLIDRVEGFENVFSKLPGGEVSLEFTDKVGVPCWFYTKVIACHKEILTELPEIIYRTQRGQYFRVDAFRGNGDHLSLWVFNLAEEGKREELHRRSVAFFMEKDLELNVRDMLMSF